jgi:mRNA interferase RelE/StbE
VYKLEVSPAADRDLEKLKNRIGRRHFERIKETVRHLAEIPRPPGVRKIKGAEKAYRVRVGIYRVVYDVYDDEHIVLILQITRGSETTYH